MLRDAGFLAHGNTPATDVNVAQFITAMLTGDAHAEAVQDAMDAFDAPACATNSGGRLFREVGFGISLATIVRVIRRGGPITVDRLAFRKSGAEMGGVIFANAAGGELIASYHCEPATDRPVSAFRVDWERNIDGAVIHELAAMACDKITGLPRGDRALADSIGQGRVTQAEGKS
jgi:predicted secreted Zn-dependent protease